MSRLVLFLIILLGNAWIWKIFKEDLLTFLLLIITTLSYFLYLTQLKFKKYLFGIFITSLVFTFLLQIINTEFHSFTLLSNDEQRIHDRRVQFYKPSLDYTRRLLYKFNLVNLLEGDIGTSLARLQRNFFETIDPNVYFFGGFPRQRVEVFDFEKFPFILIIPFFVGFYRIVRERNWSLLIYFGTTLVLVTFIGHKNILGPVSLFPFFVITIFIGLLILLDKIKKISMNNQKVLVSLALLIYILSLIQNFNYA